MLFQRGEWTPAYECAGEKLTCRTKHQLEKMRQNSSIIPSNPAKEDEENKIRIVIAG